VISILQFLRTTYRYCFHFIRYLFNYTS